MFVVSLSHFDQVLVEDSTANGLQESLRVFSECIGNEWLEDTQFELIFNFMDLFEHKIGTQGKSLSVCFEDYDWNRDGIDPRNFVISRYFLNEIADSAGYQVPTSLIQLCAVFYGDEVDYALKFIIRKFKEKIPLERVDSVRIHSICALNGQDVKEVFDEIASCLPPAFERVHDQTERNEALSVAKSKGLEEMKVVFPLVVFAVIMLSAIFIFLPFDVVSYLEVAATSWMLIAVVWYYYLGKDVLIPRRITYLVFISMVIVWILNVVVVVVNASQSGWTWSVYILFPIEWMLLCFVVISYRTFYWFWNQTWTLFWCGTMLIATGLAIDMNISTAMWIIGVCMLAASAVMPFVAYLRFKRSLLTYTC